MAKKDLLTRSLIWAGSVLVWSPILFTIGASAAATMLSGRPRFDWLMPAELFPVALPGALLLLWASLRAGSYRALVGWGLAAAIGFLTGTQVLAVTTGLASGAAEATGWPRAICVASIVLYTFALVELGIGGILLVRNVSGR